MPHSQTLRHGRHSAQGQSYLLTTNTSQRQPIFADLHCARALIRNMRRCTQAGMLDSLAWVVMPDHLHWLITLQTAQLHQLMRSLKAGTSMDLHRSGQHHGPVWQSGFHDHALRREEDIRAIARYIVANPLRAGLCARVTDYPHWDAIWL